MMLRGFVRASAGIAQSVAAGALKAAEALVLGGIETVGSALEQAAGGLEDAVRSVKTELIDPVMQEASRAIRGETAEVKEKPSQTP